MHVGQRAFTYAFVRRLAAPSEGWQLSDVAGVGVDRNEGVYGSILAGIGQVRTVQKFERVAAGASPVNAPSAQAAGR